MSALILKAVLAFSMLFGAVGGTAALTNASQPDSPLYPLKLTMEGARLAFAGQPESQAALQLSFTHERAEEIARLAQNGLTPNDALQEQLRTHWREAFRQMAQSPEEEMLALLAQAEVSAQQQQQMLNNAFAFSGAPDQTLQLQNKFLIQVREQASFGLQEPQAFRHQLGQLADNTPDIPNGFGDGNCEVPGDCEAGGPYGPGNEEALRPGPGPGGPNVFGDQECETPGDCEGDGPYGPGNEEAPRPGPGPGGPNPDGDGDGDGNHYGDDNGQNGDENGQNGGDNDQNGDDNGQNGGDNDQNGGDNGQNGGDGGDNGQNGGDGGDNGGGGGDNGGGGGDNGGGGGG